MKRSNAKISVFCDMEIFFQNLRRKKIIYTYFLFSPSIRGWPIEKDNDGWSPKTRKFVARSCIYLSVDLSSGKKKRTFYMEPFSFFPNVEKRQLDATDRFPIRFAHLVKLGFDYFVLLLTLTTFTFKFRVRVECEWDVRGFFYIIFNDIEYSVKVLVHNIINVNVIALWSMEIGTRNIVQLLGVIWNTIYGKLVSYISVKHTIFTRLVILRCLINAA